MEIRTALKEQYHAGLAMLAECVGVCPEELWTLPNVAPSRPEDPPWGGIDRPFWRIAFHDAYFTHLYLGQGADAFQPPPAGSAVRRRPEFEEMWRAPWEIEPYELAPGTEPCQPTEVLEYIRFVDGVIDGTVEGLDLESQESGFSWYPNISKLSHQLMNLRHLQGHVGQLSELLMQHGVDTNWVAKVNRMLP